MALKLSKNVGLTDVITTSNPLTTQHINTGEAKQTLVYLFNDTSNKKYESVVVSAIDTTGTNEANWMQFAPDDNGTPGTFSNTLNMANISDNNVGKAFWVKVTSASVTDSQNKTDLSIRITANEFAV